MNKTDLIDFFQKRHGPRLAVFKCRESQPIWAVRKQCVKIGIGEKNENLLAATIDIYFHIYYGRNSIQIC